jgi:hypothetical protein
MRRRTFDRLGAKHDQLVGRSMQAVALKFGFFGRFACSDSGRWGKLYKTKKPAAHEEVAGAGAGSRTVRSCIRPGHFGGGGGPLAETFVRIGRPSAP